VLSYNIHHGEGIDGKLDLARIAEIIKSARPDLVALQEVDVETQRSGGIDQAADLSRRTGMQVVFGGNLDYQGGRYGNAVLSRFPILEHRNHALPNPADTEPRGVLEVVVSHDGQVGEAQLTFLATHLDNSDEENRLVSAEWINAFALKRQDSPIILAGDLNAVPGSSVMVEMARSWSPTGQTPMPTVPVKDPVRQIDYVLYRPAGRWSPVEVRVLPEPVASDHLPILAVLELRPRHS
jgi:endonuclease/exonuclease/phosphatase family metal-dependent hydrolase